MADVGQTLGRQWCLGNKVGAVWCLFKFDLMSYDKAVNDFQFWWIQGLINASVTIMFHGLIKPCIHLIKSHQLYIVLFLLISIKYVYTKFDYYVFFVIATQVTKPTFTPIFLVFYVVLLSLFCLRSVSFVQCCPVHLDCPFLMSLRISLTFINTVWPYLGRV